MFDSKEEYNRGGMTAFIFSMSFVVLFFIYLVVIHPGVNLNENVKDPTANLAGAAAAPAFDIATVKEPWVKNDEVLAYGKKVFNTNCAMCHGEQGKGDGPAGGALKPPPRNLVEGKWTQGGGAISHFKVVTNGIPGTSMAAFGHFKVGDRWALIQFIESITQNKSTDTPEQVAEFAKTAK